jgi:hypothetical protein
MRSARVLPLATAISWSAFQKPSSKLTPVRRPEIGAFPFRFLSQIKQEQRAGVIDQLLNDANKQDEKAHVEGTPVTEVAPAE